MEREGEEKLDLLYYLEASASTQIRVAEVFQYGVKKHGKDDWKRHPKEQYLGACFRHLFPILKGYHFDKESNKKHLHHAIANLIMYSEQEWSEC